MPLGWFDSFFVCSSDMEIRLRLDPFNYGLMDPNLHGISIFMLQFFLPCEAIEKIFFRRKVIFFSLEPNILNTDFINNEILFIIRLSVSDSSTNVVASCVSLPSHPSNDWMAECVFQGPCASRVDVMRWCVCNLSPSSLPLSISLSIDYGCVVKYLLSNELDSAKHDDHCFPSLQKSPFHRFGWEAHQRALCLILPTCQTNNFSLLTLIEISPDQQSTLSIFTTLKSTARDRQRVVPFHFIAGRRNKFCGGDSWHFFNFFGAQTGFFVRFCWEKKVFSENFQKLRVLKPPSPPLPPSMLYRILMSR